MLRERVVGSVLVLVACASPLAIGAAQSCRPTSSSAPDEALQLAVKLKTYEGTGFFQDGAGIIIGEHAGTLYVATAAHVVEDAGAPVDSIHAYFFTDCSKPVTAKICSKINHDLDLAVLCVRGAKPPSMSRLGNVRRLSAQTPVYPVGCPSGECWGVGQPDKVLVAGPNQARILFTTFFVAPGHSGGPLFNEWWEVVGMLTKQGQPLSEAIPIDSVLNAACKKPCRHGEETLEAPFVPRGGYRLTLGFNRLLGDAVGAPGGRAPAGRFNLMYRISPLVELHAGSVRLIPENLSVTGAMVGLGLNLPKQGRVWLNPFLEGGFGHLEGRYDAGGYYVDNGGTNVYTPLWRQVQDDALGYGAGISLMALVLPHTIVEVMTGHWSFNSPPNAPAMPDIVFGAGLRFGM